MASSRPTCNLRRSPGHRPACLYVGRLHPQKGVEVLLDAFARLAPTHPGVDLTIAGDGQLRRELEQQAHDLGIERRVEFIGWVAPDRVQALMNLATIVVMPSREEVCRS